MELLGNFVSHHPEVQVYSLLGEGTDTISSLDPSIEGEVKKIDLQNKTSEIVFDQPSQPTLLLLESSQIRTYYSYLLEWNENPELNLTILVLNAGLLGRPIPTLSQETVPADLKLLTTFPQWRIYSPNCREVFQEILERGLHSKGIDVIRCASFPWVSCKGIDSGKIQIEQMTLVTRGAQGIVLATGSTVAIAVEVAQLLKLQAIHLEVVEIRQLQPFDSDGLKRLTERHQNLFTLEDHSTSGGLGAIVGENLPKGSASRLTLLGWPNHSHAESFNSENLGVASHSLHSEQVAREIELCLAARDSEAAARRLLEVPKVDLEKAHKFITEVKDIQLNPWFVDLIKEYEQVGDRNSFLWRWVRRGVEITTLSTVPEERWDHVCDTKALGVVFDVLVDDVADAESDSHFLEKLIAITRDEPVDITHLSEKRKKYFLFTLKVWKLMWERFSSYPRYEEFKDVLKYDYRQLMNSMRYSLLIKDHPFIMNVAEHDAYLPHNMHMVASGTIDVMTSEEFDIEDMGRLRKILLYAQYMGRIGNLVTTWEREIWEKDYSSGVFPLGLALGVLSVEDLQQGDPEYIRDKIRDSDIEKRFMYRWQQLRLKILDQAVKIRSVDVRKLVTGLETLIQLHLGSRGLK